MTLDEYAAQYNETNRIQVKDYHPRLSNKTDTYHNFPRMIEDKVIKSEYHHKELMMQCTGLNIMVL